MSEKRPPNVLFILSDQHNAKVLGHRGHPDVKTPHLDRMAAEGVCFTNAVTVNPICTPSRMSFHSGQYCHNHGYYGLHGPKPGGLPTLFGHFRRAGYRTALIGKNHCPEYWVEDDTDVFREVGGCSIGGNPEYRAYINERGVWDDYAYSVERKGPSGYQCVDGFPGKLVYRDTAEGWVATEAIRFMQESQAAGRPFFLHASFPKPHQVYAPAQEFWDLYDQASIQLPPNADYEMRDKPPTLLAMRKQFETEDWFTTEPRTYEAGRLRKLHGYLGCVSQVDCAVGELLDALRANGLDENTIVVYSSDHGDYATEHGIIEKAPGIGADAITRIPFIWRWPGHFKADHTAEEIVESVDVSQTLCALSGLEPLETSDGKDLSGLLRGEGGAVHEIGVTEFAWSKSVRKGRYRYVHYQPAMFPKEYPDGFGELYDLEADPWEMRNLFFDPDFAGVIDELRTDLLNWLIRTTRPATALHVGRFETRQGVTRYRRTVNHDGKFHPDRLIPDKQANYL